MKNEKSTKTIGFSADDAAKDYFSKAADDGQPSFT
jgi:hypothetical protein